MKAKNGVEALAIESIARIQAEEKRADAQKEHQKLLKEQAEKAEIERKLQEKAILFDRDEIRVCSGDILFLPDNTFFKVFLLPEKKLRIRPADGIGRHFPKMLRKFLVEEICENDLEEDFFEKKCRHRMWESDEKYEFAALSYLRTTTPDENFALCMVKSIIGTIAAICIFPALIALYTHSSKTSVVLIYAVTFALMDVAALFAHISIIKKTISERIKYKREITEHIKKLRDEVENTYTLSPETMAASVDETDWYLFRSEKYNEEKKLLRKIEKRIGVS